jgi:hypothetical protein
MARAERFDASALGPELAGAAVSRAPRTLREALPVFLRHGSPRILIAALALALGARLALGDWSAWDALPVAAILAFWPIQEWLIHVFILHAKPLRLFGRSIDFRVPREHRAHHREPWRLELLFIPLHSFLYSIPILLALWLALAPTRALALTGITFHLALSLHYEWVHFLVHTRVAPRHRYYQRLWKNHRRHHFKNEHFWFGVTMLSGDRLFGTAPAFQQVASSPTARSLEDVRPSGL